MNFATVTMGFFLISWQDAIIRWFSITMTLCIWTITLWSSTHLILLFLFVNSSLANIISSWSRLISLSDESIDSEISVFGCIISILNEFISEKNDSFTISKSSINFVFKGLNFFFKLIWGLAIFNGVSVSLWAM